MKLLMHICCAPCANMPIDALRADGIDLTGYWYNPNIHPFTEYRARRNCLQEYAKTIELPLLMRDDYGLRPFVREVADDIAGRCVKCYEMRLFEAARAAIPARYTFWPCQTRPTEFLCGLSTILPQEQSVPTSWAWFC